MGHISSQKRARPASTAPPTFDAVCLPHLQLVVKRLAMMGCTGRVGLHGFAMSLHSRAVAYGAGFSFCHGTWHAILTNSL